MVEPVEHINEDDVYSCLDHEHEVYSEIGEIGPQHPVVMTRPVQRENTQSSRRQPSKIAASSSRSSSLEGENSSLPKSSVATSMKAYLQKTVGSLKEKLQTHELTLPVKLFIPPKNLAEMTVVTSASSVRCYRNELVGKTKNNTETSSYLKLINLKLAVGKLRSSVSSQGNRKSSSPAAAVDDWSVMLYKPGLVKQRLYEPAVASDENDYNDSIDPSKLALLDLRKGEHLEVLDYYMEPRYLVKNMHGKIGLVKASDIDLKDKIEARFKEALENRI